MSNNNFKHFLIGLCTCFSLLAGFVACTDDDSDQPLNFYSSVRLTAAGFIEADDSRFSEFKAVLERSNYLSMLKTYGHYTVFAPTNEAMDIYLKANGYGSVADMPREECDTLSRAHIVQDKAYFTTDMGGEVAPVNMNDDFIEMTSDSDVYNNNALLVYVNKNSLLIQKDDSVTNGVVHVIDHVINASSQFLPALMEDNPNLSIFCQALRLTGMADSLKQYIDLDYSCSDDSVHTGTMERCTSGGATYTRTFWVGKRYFKYTAFVEPDSVFHRNGIYRAGRWIDWYLPRAINRVTSLYGLAVWT